MNEFDDIHWQVVTIAIEAGKKIMEVYQEDRSYSLKQDESPITRADIDSHNYIKEELSKISTLPQLSEESSEIAYEDRRYWEGFWLIDPLDGTKEFCNGNDEFTVNIALIHQNEPVFGVVHAPALNVTYMGGEFFGSYKKENDEWTQLKSITPDRDFEFVVSKSHNNDQTIEYIIQFDKRNLQPVGSSLKLCFVAEGKADCYPRFGPTMEWDIAAAHSVVKGAEGFVVDEDGNSLSYNKSDLHNPYFICQTNNFSYLSSVKQVIVMRRKYDGKKLRTGKMIAQGCHASMKVFFDLMVSYQMNTRFELTMTKEMKRWKDGAFAKVCVYVDTEEELLDIVQQAEDSDLPVALITDSGKTEFHGVPTNTCCAIGPALSKDIDKITGDLKLL